MKILQTLILLIAVYTCTAQNLVPNPGFAEYLACPDSGGHRQITKCKYWDSYVAGGLDTADYFTACAGTVPNHFWGFQATHDSAYAGCLIQYTGANTNLRATIPALEAGTRYKVTIVVSLADSAMLADNHLGVLFYLVAPDSTSSYRIDNHVPQVTYSDYGYIATKTGWITLASTFIADSAYTHIVVGGFKTDTVSFQTVDTCCYNVCYYYFDSVAVEKIGPAGITATAGVRVDLAPNPVKDNALFTFDYEATEQYSLIIYNMQGGIVQQMDKLTSGRVAISRKGMPGGLYYYRLLRNGLVIANGKMVAE